MESRLNEQRKGQQYSRYVSFVVIASVLFVFISKYRLFAFRYSVLLYLSAICLVPIVFFFVKAIRTVRIRLPHLCYFLFTIALIGNSFSGSANRTDSLIFAINKLLLFFLFYYLSSTCNWQTTFCKYVDILAKILVVSVLIELLFPNVISNINAVIMNLNDYSTYKRLYSMGYHLGFSVQASYLAFNVSILLSILIGRIMAKKSQRTDLVWLLACVLVVILSGKRAEFVGVVISVALVIVLMVFGGNVTQRRKIGIIFMCVVISGITVYLLFYTSYGTLLFEKGLTFSYDNTRTFLLNEGLNLWRRSPITGNGTNYFSQNYELSTHNTYLQLLCDNGIIGLVLFLGFVLPNIIKTITLFLKIGTNDSKSSIVIASICFQVFFLISAYFESMFSNEVMWIVYLIMSAVTYSVTEESGLASRESIR